MFPLEIQWQRSAIRALAKLPEPERLRIVAAIEGYATDGSGDVTILRGSGRPPQRRLRVGGWRVLFVLEQPDTMIVRRIGPRGDVYKKT